MVVVIFHLTTNDVCIVLLIWHSKHGWFDEREAGTKKLWRRWCHGPNTTISQNLGGWGAGGCCIQGPGPAAPPPPVVLGSLKGGGGVGISEHLGLRLAQVA